MQTPAGIAALSQSVLGFEPPELGVLPGEVLPELEPGVVAAPPEGLVVPGVVVPDDGAPLLGAAGVDEGVVGLLTVAAS